MISAVSLVLLMFDYMPDTQFPGHLKGIIAAPVIHQDNFIYQVAVDLLKSDFQRFGGIVRR